MKLNMFEAITTFFTLNNFNIIQFSQFKEALAGIEKGLFSKAEFDLEANNLKYKAKMYRVANNLIRVDLMRDEK